MVRKNATAESALREAVVTMLAAIAALLCTLAIANGTGPAVLSVVLCLSLARSQLDRDWRHRIEAAVALPMVGIVAIGVGFLLEHTPWLGAAVFVAGMFASIWLRRFGDNAQRAGSLIALPLVALLVTPPMRTDPTGSVPVLLPIIIGWLALLWVAVLHELAHRIGFLPRPAERRPRRAAAAPTRKPIASTRMAIQMAIALALSFVIGYVFFVDHWAWIVLTAFIVNSGNRGRLDVAYKSVLRVAGAAAGTLLALALSVHLDAHPLGTGAAILAAVFIGLWLRPLGYAWWAMFVTIALALLQGFAADLAPAQILLPRLAEIIIGALIGVSSAWWALPIRSTDVLRRRIADALGALSNALDPKIERREPDEFIAAIAEMERLAPVFRASRLIRHSSHGVQPAQWIDALIACRDPALALIQSGDSPENIRRAIGTARKALADLTELGPALQKLERSLIRYFTVPEVDPAEHASAAPS